MRFVQLFLALIFTTFTTQAFAAKELNVAYFLEWPTPNQAAQVEEVFAKKLGMKVNWRSFDNGNAMTQAMIAGDIDIAYSQGFVPFVLGVTKGVDMKLIGVAMTYAENDNCVAQTKLGITKANAGTKLKGLKIGSPTGNVTHYKLLKMLEHFGVSQDDVTILSMSNTEASSAFVRGDVDVGCSFGGALNRMVEKGNVIMTGAEQEEIGLKVFDIISVTDKFAEKNPEVVEQFMQITEDYNDLYKKNPSRYHEIIAKAAGMKFDGAVDTLGKFTFLTSEQQLSKQWMGGGLQTFTKEVADFFVEQGKIRKSLSQAQYSKVIDSSFLKKIN